MSAHPIHRLGDLVEVKGGKRLPLGTAYVGHPTNHAYIRVVDVENNSIRRERLEYISEETHRQVAKYTISSDDVFISIAGSIGLIATIPAELSDANLTENAAKLVIKDRGRLDRDYLARYLATAGQTEIQQRAFATGQPKLALFRIEEIPISLPPLAEQRRIVDILDKADAIRRKRKEAIALTEELLRSAFLEMFGDPVTNPKGWDVKPLGRLTPSGDSINYGVVQPGPEVSDGVPLVRVGDFEGMAINIHGLKRISPDIERNYARSRLRGDEVLVACVGSIGKVALADERLVGANIARAVARVRPGPLLTRNYLAYFLATPFAQRHFSVETRTVSQPTLNIKQIQETPILVPPRSAQDAFTILERKLRTVGQRQRDAFDATVALFDSLAHRAFRGELTGLNGAGELQLGTVRGSESG